MKREKTLKVTGRSGLEIVVRVPKLQYTPEGQPDAAEWLLNELIACVDLLANRMSQGATISMWEIQPIGEVAVYE